MPPNKWEASFEVSNVKESNIPFIPPVTDPMSLFEGGLAIRLPLNTGTNLDIYFQPLPPPEFYASLNFSTDNNLRNLVQRVTRLNNIENVTQLKLRVISQDVCLQNLSIYTPNLTELDLTGSSISSLRDLGCELKNLKVLKVNYCGLYVLDGLFGLQTVRELYAGHNFIKDISPCSFLPAIERIDMRYNLLEDINTISFLTNCENLKYMVLEGNRDIVSQTDYRSKIRNTLRNLESLDEIPFTDEDGLLLPNLENKERKNILKSLDDSVPSTSKETQLPPINEDKTNSCSPSKCFKTKSGYETDLPKVPSPKDSTGTLTSGAPVCGNVAVALKNRKKNNTAKKE